MAISSKKSSNEGKGGLLIKIRVGCVQLQVIMQCSKLVNVLNEWVM